MTEPLTALQALTIVGIIAAFSYIIETLVEALVGRPIDEFPKLKRLKAHILTYSAVLVGIAGALVYKFDVIYLLVTYLQEVIGQPIPIGSTTFGVIATGCTIGMGSTYIHDFIGRYFLKKGEPMVVNTTTITTSPNPEA